jgi:hypothetical protein
MFTAMASEVALSIAIEVEATRHNLAWRRSLPNGRMHGSALPLDIARTTDVYRNKRVHLLVAPHVESTTVFLPRKLYISMIVMATLNASCMHRHSANRNT